MKYKEEKKTCVCVFDFMAIVLEFAWVNRRVLYRDSMIGTALLFIKEAVMFMAGW